MSADGLAYDAANWGASVVAVPMGIDINYMRLTRKGSGDTAFKIIGAIDAQDPIFEHKNTRVV